MKTTSHQQQVRNRILNLTEGWSPLMGTQLPPLLWAGTHGHLGKGWPSHLKIRSLICSSIGLWGDEPETLELGTTTITRIVMTEQEGGAWVQLTSYTECFRKTGHHLGRAVFPAARKAKTTKIVLSFCFLHLLHGFQNRAGRASEPQGGGACWADRLRFCWPYFLTP